MRAKVQPRAEVPVRLQLGSILSAEIESGRYSTGSRLPSERQLAVTYRTSRTSVRQALADLEERGVLVRTAGKGTFVSRGRVETGAKSKSARAQTIAFVVDENLQRFVEAGYNRILLGARKACQESGYRLLFYSVGEDDGELEHGIDGCIVAGGAPRRLLERLRANKTPLVLADLLLLDESEGSIGFDYAGGMRQAIAYLHGLGHRRIGFVGFPNSEKYVAYWQTMAALGLTYEPRFVEFLQLPDLQPSILSGYRTLRKMLAAGRLPTALIATNDLVAYGMLEALAVAGIAVPEGVSVMGFDDLGHGAHPPLTTIRTDSAQVGMLAVRALLDRIDGGPAPEARIAVPIELVIRSSTAPPPAAAGAAE